MNYSELFPALLSVCIMLPFLFLAVRHANGRF